jgi:hypothetical protein
MNPVLEAVKGELAAAKVAMDASSEVKKSAKRKASKPSTKAVSASVSASTSRGIRASNLHASIAVEDRAPALYCAQLSEAVYSDAALQFMGETTTAKKAVELSPAAGVPPSVALQRGMSEIMKVQWGVFHLKWADDRHVLAVAFRGSEYLQPLDIWHDWVVTDFDVLFPDTVDVPSAKPPAKVKLHAGFNRAFE